MRTASIALVLAASWLAAGAALAARPALQGEATYGVASGSILVHYATAGADAAPTADGNGDGVPDFVAEVATTAEDALVRFAAMGFRRPISDGVEGGDGRIDFYLRNMVNADGNAAVETCVGARCSGYASTENDFVGFRYATVTEAIRSVVPHELFHLVQMAYAAGQTASWSEGSAVWAVEELYGAGNSDFERFLASFLTKSFRPFERSAGGFSDSYPYGASLWSYFLSHRFDPALIVEAWQASETEEFLAAIDTALERRGSSLEAAFIEMTQWNWFTGGRAAGGAYPDASTWPQVPVEPALVSPGAVYLEGLSARYVPIWFDGEPQQLVVKPTKGIKVAGWIVGDGGGLGDGVALAAVSGAAAGSLGAVLDPGHYTLVLTGLSPNTITTEVGLELTAPPVARPDDEEGAGGCSATGGGAAGAGLPMAAALGLFFVAPGLRKRRRAVAAAR